MDRSAGVARLVSVAVAHELANQMQPVLAALRAAENAEPAQRKAMLEMAREAVKETLALGEALRRASSSGGADVPSPLPELAELALRSLPNDVTARVTVKAADLDQSAPSSPMVALLGHLVRHAARLAGNDGKLELVLGGKPGVLVRYGGPSPSRDDVGIALPVLELKKGELRLSPDLAMASMISATHWGEKSLRAAHGDRSGHLEVWLEAQG